MQTQNNSPEKKAKAPRAIDIAGGDGKISEGIGYGNPEEAAVYGLGSKPGQRPGVTAGAYNTEGGEGDQPNTPGEDTGAPREAGKGPHHQPGEDVPKEEQRAASPLEKEEPYPGVTRQRGEQETPKRAQVASDADENASARATNDDDRPNRRPRPEEHAQNTNV